VLWAGWYDYVLPRASGLTPEFADQQLMLAAREFCERTMALTMRGAATATDTDEDYALTFTGGYETVKVRRVWYDGRKLTPINVEQLSEDNAEDWADEFGTPVRWTHDQSIDRIRLVPRHEGPDKPIAYLASVKPPVTGAGLRDDFAKRYYEAIGDGALWRVLAIPRRPWSDPNQAALCKARFDAEADTAHAMAARGFADDFLRRGSRARFM
jgi:hypothetical protein